VARRIKCHHYGAVGADYHGISVIRPGGTDEKALTMPSAATDDFQPDFSPIGKRIVFDRYNQVQDDLYVMRTNGSGLKALTNTSDLELSPAFSPNGAKVSSSVTTRTSRLQMSSSSIHAV
jgi:Tol biopolymer transport system component